MLRLTLGLIPLLMTLAACSDDAGRSGEAIGTDGATGESATTTVSAPQAGSGMEAPPLDPQDDSLLATLDGESLSLGDFSGQYVLLNYWATWCAPCIEEIPALLSAADQLGSDYHLLLVSDEPADTIREFLADNDFDGDFIRLTRAFASHGVRAVPSTVLYDPDGKELNQWLGAKEWDSREMLSEIRALP